MAQCNPDAAKPLPTDREGAPPGESFRRAFNTYFGTDIPNGPTEQVLAQMREVLDQRIAERARNELTREAQERGEYATPSEDLLREGRDER